VNEEELEALKRVSDEFEFPQNSDEVIVFGGSFSPWHDGHRISVELCQKVFPHALIMVTPDRNPFKTEYQTGLSLYQELENVTKEWQNVFVFPKFLLLTEGNPTVNWLPDLPYKKKWLLIGEDSFSSIETWKDSSKLLSKLTGLVVSPRLKGEEWFNEHRSYLQFKNPHLQIKRLPSHPFEHLNSTELRQK
jgi:nicotinic acid mononucleotide adenylyltransferase